ncbi:MAG TPA: NAD(P)H-dependent oxidoreductase subunit E [Thermoleophilaceae bacterium]|nr:NAD(P)H-dependent oxidoreductase subunit E [Thermoleophilaceae bacterium]
MAGEEYSQRTGDEGAVRAAPLPPGWDTAVDIDKPPATVPDPAEVQVPEALREQIETIMARYPDRHSAALPAMRAAQEAHGWCSPLAIDQVASVMQVTPAYLSSVATFYDMLRTQPTGPRYVYVCTSVACHLRNAKAVYDAIAEEARDQDLEGVEVREFECLGACDMAPMASVDGRYVGPLDDSDAHELVAAIREGRIILPGRGLEDADYRLPWDPDAETAQSAGPEATGSELHRKTQPQEPEPPHPDVSPPGGTVKDRPEEEPEGQ